MPAIFSPNNATGHAYLSISFIMCTANLVAKLGEDANNAIESQAKKVEALGSKADLTEDNASKMVEDTGKIKLCMVIIHSCHNVFAYG